jgi:ABC-2 type transport system permease protein
VIGRPGSTLWLLSAEMRLGVRDMLGRRGALRGLLIAGAALVLVFALGLPVARALRGVGIPVTPFSVAIADAAMAVVFTLMLSQTLAAATLALYSRGDLDLLFSSPIAPRKVLTVRFAAIALNAFAAFALLITPPLLPVAVLGHWGWLSVIVVLGALAFAASACGLLLATALFGMIGARRTRTVAQVLAALIGAAFFLAAQARNILGGPKTASLWFQLAEAVRSGRLRPPPAASLPLRAMLGEPLPLLGLVAVAAALFLGASQWLGARFAADAAAASGVDASGQTRTRRTPARAFAAGATAATFRKELRLLWRDAALLSQVFLRVLYLLPLAFLLLRNAASSGQYALPASVAALTFMTGQVSGTLSWVTVSAEDAPDLLAASPAAIGVLIRAKLAAALTPVAVLLVLPLAGLIVLAPVAGLAATAGCAASALASSLINTWYNRPGKRSEFRRRRAGTWVSAIAQTLVTTLIGLAAALAAWPSLFALAPALVAAGALLLLRRSDAQVAEGLRAAD